MQLRRLSFCSVATLAAGVLFMSWDANAQPNYTYTVIADTSNCNTGFPALGNNGEAAFFVQCGAYTAVQKGDGVTQTDIYHSQKHPNPYGPMNGTVSINDLGWVAFAAYNGSINRYGIVAGNGGPLTVVADSAKRLDEPSINNSGAVSYQAFTTDTYYEVIRANGDNTFTTIAKPGDDAPGAGKILRAIDPALNNAGEVAFFVDTEEGNHGIFIGPGDPLTRIATAEAVGSSSGITDAGRVVFYGQLGNKRSILTGKGGALTTIASPGSFFESFSHVAAINNSNAVAFSARPVNGPLGVFVGDGVLTQKVIQEGDHVQIGDEFGTVIWVFISNEAINDHGQVAFVVQYKPDGCDNCFKRAIVRADPILPQITRLKFTSPVAGCLPVTATVTLDRVAPPGGVLIDIENTNSAATTPETLKIASNKTSGKFTISTTPVASNQIGTITVTLGSSTEDRQLTVRPIGVQSVTLSPNTIKGGQPVTGKVTLECAAAPDGITVALSSTKPSVAEPANPSLLFPAGTKAMTFQVNTSPVPVDTTATIKATANGITKSKKLTVTP